MFVSCFACGGDPDGEVQLVGNRPGGPVNLIVGMCLECWNVLSQKQLPMTFKPGFVLQEARFELYAPWVRLEHWQGVD
jgi:hypothetical protein